MKNKFRWLHVIDSSNLMVKFNVSVIPTIFIIDEKGEVRYRYTGVVSDEVLKKKIDELLD